jgi:hypothetical protein|nr:MAG TPA: hypothetical protein [Caudoviricetes sp.]
MLGFAMLVQARKQNIFDIKFRVRLIKSENIQTKAPDNQIIGCFHHGGVGGIRSI